MSATIPEGAREMERLLMRIRAIGAQLLSMDMYDRWGQGGDPAMNEVMAQADGVRADHQRTTTELHALAAQLRRDDPKVVEYWADAHERLLARFLETTTEATARFVAEGERTAWRALREGTGPVVEENVYYVHVDPALHRELFGEPPSPVGDG